MDPGVSDSLGGVFPNKVYATLEIRVCSRNYQCTPAGKINSIDSRVHGNRTLYAEARPYHYKLYIYICWFRVLLPRGDVEGGNSEALMITTTYYYTLLQQLLLQCYFIYVDINCWLILPPCCKTTSEDASLR